MTREEYQALVAIHTARIETAINDALEAGVVFRDFKIEAIYPPELSNPVPKPEPTPDPEPLVAYVGSAATDSRTAHLPAASLSDLPHTPVFESKRCIEAPASQRFAAGFSGDVCSNCGSPDIRPNGSCLLCANCGTTTGCG